MAACAASAAPSEERERPQLWFPQGETLTYRLHWGFIPIGEARVWNEWAEFDGRELLAIRVRIRTNAFMDAIYPVNDFLESLVEPEGFLPVRFERNVSEGRYRLHEVTTFDHKAGKAHWRHLLKGTEETFSIESDTRDIISFMYHTRSRKLEPHSEYKFRVMADEKIYNVEVKTHGYDRFRLPGFNWVESLKVEPTANFEGLFVRVGRAAMWVSGDERRLCTKASVEVPVASVSAVLIGVEGPGEDFWARPAMYKRKKDGALVREGDGDE